MAGKTGSAKSQSAAPVNASTPAGGNAAANTGNARGSTKIRGGGVVAETLDSGSTQGVGSAEQQSQNASNATNDSNKTDDLGLNDMTAAAAAGTNNDDINNRNKETYIAYLEEHNIVDMLVKALQLLYAEPENPDRVVEFLKTTIWGEEYLARVASRQTLEQDLKNLHTELAEAESQLQRVTAEAEALGLSTVVELEYPSPTSDGAESKSTGAHEQQLQQPLSPLFGKPAAPASALSRQSQGQNLSGMQKPTTLAALRQESNATTIQFPPPTDAPPDEDQNDSDQWSWSGDEESDSDFDYFDGVWDALLNPNGNKDDMLLAKDTNAGVDDDNATYTNEK